MGHVKNQEHQDFEKAVQAGDRQAMWHAAGHVWNCTDTLPATLCDKLGMSPGSSYAQAARRARGVVPLPSWEQIASDLDVEVGYLLKRCLRAEGKDIDDTEAMIALITDAQAAWRA